jgi:hypothetical protein
MTNHSYYLNRTLDVIKMADPESRMQVRIRQVRWTSAVRYQRVLRDTRLPAGSTMWEAQLDWIRAWLAHGDKLYQATIAEEKRG